MRNSGYGSGVFLLVIGAAVAAVIGYAAYKLISTPQDGSQQVVNYGDSGEYLLGDYTNPSDMTPVQPQFDSNLDYFVDYIQNLPLERTIGHTHPNEYYMDHPQVDIPSVIPQSASVVENDEKVTWTDWMGRDRNVVISRKVR